MPVRVSVIVPAYDPGHYLDRLIASLLRQSMPPAAFEVIFVNDGSTDRTPHRLDTLAREHAHVHVIHQENSGWPGRPRNVGLDASRGEYVFFADADDWLGDQALARMYDFATANRADILIPRSVGHLRNVPRDLFARDIPATTVRETPSVTTAMTPHKLIRRAFLLEHGIRFPEGRRRLEDHIFVIEAYLRGRVLSVLAGYPCYHHRGRADRGNISRSPYEPEDYFASVREVLDLIDAQTVPGPLRDRLYHRWYNTELLGRVGGPAFLRRPEDFQRQAFDGARRLSLDRFGEHLIERFGPARRVRAHLVRLGDLPAYRRFLIHDQTIRARARLTSFGRTERDVLCIGLAGVLEHPEGRLLRPAGDGLAYVLPEEVERRLPAGATDLDVGLDTGPDVGLRDGRVLVALREREAGTEYLLPASCELSYDREHGSLAFTASARVDARRAAAGEPLPAGTWGVRVRVEAGGWSKPAWVRVGTRLPAGVDPVRHPAIPGRERPDSGGRMTVGTGAGTRLVLRVGGMDSLARTQSTSTCEGARRMPVKVSVVVPVYNPGPYIEDLIASLLRQTLPAEEFEAIFVDDGSTDETPARLDRMAAEHSHLRVIHQENSGWPGKPRNVGIDAARGEFVFFCDNDDWLGDEALARMYDFATANQADVLVPKMAGIGRGVPRELFRRTRTSATLVNAPLIDSLTPHKLFRKALLDEHGLRFPEGRRRLEDHVFVTAAYFAAERISVLADYVCYYHIRREDVSNAGFQPIEPKGYFANLSEALDIVAANTGPGKLRDRLYRRWLRVEMVERLRGRRLLLLEPENRRELFDEIKRVVTTYFGPGVAAGLAPAHRLVTALVEAGRLDTLEQLAEWEVLVRSQARLERLEWDTDGGLDIAVKASLRAGDEPVGFEHREGRDILRPRLAPEMLEAVPDSALDCTKRLAKSKIDVLVRHRDTKTEFFLPIAFEASRVPLDGSEPGGDSAGAERFTLEWTGRARLDPERISGAEPLTSGLWDVMVRVNCAGWVKDARLAAPTEPAAPAAGSELAAPTEPSAPAAAAELAVRPTPALIGTPARMVTPYRTDKYDNLAVDVGQTLRRLDRNLLDADAEKPAVRSDGADFVLTVPLRIRTAGTAQPTVVLVNGRDRLVAEAVLKPTGCGGPGRIGAAQEDAAQSADAAQSDGAAQNCAAQVGRSEAGGIDTAELTCTVPRSRISAGKWQVRVRFSEAPDNRPVDLPLRLVVPVEGELQLKVVSPRRRGRAEREPGQERERRLVPSAPPSSRGLAGRLYRVARRIRRRMRTATAKPKTRT